MAEHLGGPDQRTAALIYNATFIVIAVAFNLLWRYAVSRDLLHDHVVMASAVGLSNQYAVGPLLYTVCLAIAWFNVRASVVANTALALFFVLPPNISKSALSLIDDSCRGNLVA